MATALPAIDLGSYQVAIALAVGGQHSCALLAGGCVKCWGSNSYGQLGQGDTNPRGDDTGEMGDWLPCIDLATTASAIAAADNHTCALLDDDTVRCWGDNTSGQLGLGDTSGRGDQPGEMGVNLPAVALGSGRTASAIAASGYHTCVLLDNDRLKCWGYNADGELGQGDTETRGDEPDEMGDHLPVLSF
jgi:alpha-tubulin suppressor-like RCC1 family protein